MSKKRSRYLWDKSAIRIITSDVEADEEDVVKGRGKFDPAKHPRAPKGSDAGGQFSSGGGQVLLTDLESRATKTGRAVTIVGGKEFEVTRQVKSRHRRFSYRHGDRHLARDQVETLLASTHSKAAPKTLYVNRPLLNADAIREWAASQGIETTLTPDDMHVTVAYSKAEVDWSQFAPDPYNMAVIGLEREVHQFPPRTTPNGALVLKFESPQLTKRWQEFRDAGASWDFPEYQPHITLTYSVPEADVDALEAYQGPLIFGPEEFSELNENWANEITEVPTSGAG